jgi:hypothetical protein
MELFPWIILTVSAAQKLCKYTPHTKYSLSFEIPNPGQEAWAQLYSLDLLGYKAFCWLGVYGSMAAKKRNGEFPNSSLSLINREERAQTKKLPEKNITTKLPKLQLICLGRRQSFNKNVCSAPIRHARQRRESKNYQKNSWLLNSQNYSLVVWGGGIVSTKMCAQHLLGVLKYARKLQKNWLATPLVYPSYGW